MKDEAFKVSPKKLVDHVCKAADGSLDLAGKEAAFEQRLKNAIAASCGRNK